MKTAVIISGGEITDYDYIAHCISDADYVVCCDSGVYHAKSMGLTPLLVVGDFDSSDKEIFPDVDKRVLKAEKDETDTQTAVDILLQRGFERIIMIGALGGRLDHELGNIAMLERIARADAEGVIISEKNEVRLVDKWHPYSGMSNGIRHKYLSLIAWGGTVSGVCVSGVKYPLCGADIPTDVTLGISNELVGAAVSVSVSQGRLLLVFSED